MYPHEIRAAGNFKESLLGRYSGNALKAVVEREPRNPTAHFTTVVLVNVSAEFHPFLQFGEARNGSAACGCVAQVLSHWYI